MWRELIPACFGDIDLDFGAHELDKERAKEMLTTAFREGANMDEICEVAASYLLEKGAPADHIETQMRKIRNFEFMEI